LIGEDRVEGEWWSSCTPERAVGEPRITRDRKSKQPRGKRKRGEKGKVGKGPASSQHGHRGGQLSDEKITTYQKKKGPRGGKGGRTGGRGLFEGTRRKQ